MFCNACKRLFRFQPRTPVRGATSKKLPSLDISPFQSTHPCAGCDHGVTAEQIKAAQFQSTHPCAGCDNKAIATRLGVTDFNPRTPVRGATDNMAATINSTTISIHAPLCGVRRAADRSAHCAPSISIHAPLGGVRLLVRLVASAPCMDFNPRTPERGATCSALSTVRIPKIFQSTHP